MSPGQPATPSATPSLCPTPPKMAPSMSPNLPDSDTSHTLTSLQPDTTYRIEVEAARKGDGADGPRGRVMGNFPTAIASEREIIVGLLNSQGCMSEVMGVRALLSMHALHTQ